MTNFVEFQLRDLQMDHLIIKIFSLIAMKMRFPMRNYQTNHFVIAITTNAVIPTIALAIIDKMDFLNSYYWKQYLTPKVMVVTIMLAIKKTIAIAIVAIIVILLTCQIQKKVNSFILF